MREGNHEKIGRSSRGMYIRNIADITINWSDICSTADIPTLGEMAIINKTSKILGDFHAKR